MYQRRLGTGCTMMVKKWFLPLRNCQSKRKISTSQLLFSFIKNARSQKKLFPSSFCRIIMKLLLLLNYSHRQTWFELQIIVRCLQKIQNVSNISKSTNFSILWKEKAGTRMWVGKVTDGVIFLNKPPEQPPQFGHQSESHFFKYSLEMFWKKCTTVYNALSHVSKYNID